MKLIIGGKDNQKILLYHNSDLIKEKTLPHLISSGKWSTFWLQIRKEEILFGSEGVPTPLFEWQHEENTFELFEPRFINYMSNNRNPIGLSFKCDECHTENTTVNVFSKIFPIGIWTNEENVHKRFSLKLRGEGAALIPLFTLPQIEYYYQLMFKKNDLIFSVVENNVITNLLKLHYKKSLLNTSKWSNFNISFTEKNLEVSTNDSIILKYRSKKPMLFYWFSVGAENGWITWVANCDPLDIDGPPIDGGWSKWSKWECTVSCGGGEGYRTRTCSNPHPNIFGRLCEGPATSTGRCNDFSCGDISPDTLEMIHHHLQSEHFSLIVEEHKSIVIKNNKKILDIVAIESPDAYYEWTLNGKIIEAQPGRLEIMNDNIFINDVNVDDMGLYVCMLYRVSKQRVVIRVVSLAVTTNTWRISTRATLSLRLLTNSVILGYIYSDLSQKWVLNDTVYLDYGITTLVAVSSLHLDPLNMSHTGEWKCVVEQSDLGLSWVTNIIKIQVKSAPNIYTHLMEDKLMAPFFAWLKTEANVLGFVIFIVVFIFGFVGFMLFAYFKWGTLPTKRKYSKVK